MTGGGELGHYDPGYGPAAAGLYPGIPASPDTGAGAMWLSAVSTVLPATLPGYTIERYQWISSISVLTSRDDSLIASAANE